jgi:multisubunit Na+/H+ antiporter MnhC subunit
MSEKKFITLKIIELIILVAVPMFVFLSDNLRAQIITIPLFIIGVILFSISGGGHSEYPFPPVGRR